MAQLEHIEVIEKRLWSAADTLRANSNCARNEYFLPVFDLLKKPDLTPNEVKRIKVVAVELLDKLKAEKVRINHWRDKESTRDAVRLTIQDYLWSEDTGLPEAYTEADVRDKTESVFVHVFRAYPIVPSPYYTSMAS